jgi:hypothetical protein
MLSIRHSALVVAICCFLSSGNLLACSIPPPTPPARLGAETDDQYYARWSALRTKERRDLLASMRVRNSSDQGRWWRTATEVRLVEVIDRERSLVRTVRTLSWIRGSGYARNVRLQEDGGDCKPTLGPLGMSRRGDLFILFVFPAPERLSFRYQWAAVKDVSNPDVKAALSRHRPDLRLQ